MKRIFFWVVAATMLIITMHGALASPFNADGFEDGDHSANPAWSFDYSDGYSVLNANATEGVYTLKFTNNGNNRFESATHDPGTSEVVTVGDYVQVWMQKVGGASDYDVQFYGSTGNYLKVVYYSTTYLRVSCNAGAASNLASATSTNWYRIRATYLGSDNWNVTAYNAAGALLGAYTQSCALAPYWDKTIIHSYDHTDLGVFYYDNVTYFTNYTAPSSGSTNNTYTVNVNDLFNDGDLTGANVTLYNATATVYSALSNSTGDVRYSVNATGAPASLSYNITKTNYSTFSAGTVLANTTATANLSQAVYTNLTVYSVVTNASVATPFNLSVQGGKNYTLTGAATNIYLRAGQMNFTWSKSGWYGLNFSQNVTVLANTTATTSGAYDALLNVTATDVLLNTTINIFNLTAQNSTWFFNDTRATTSGSTGTPVLQGLEYLLLIDAPGYSLANTTITPTNSTPRHQFTLYTQNSVYVNIFDEDLGTPIYANITIVVSGANYSTTNYTATSTFFVDNLLDGDYSFKLSGENYTLKTYTVTVGGRSTQTLNAYLSASTSQTIFTMIDRDSLATLEGVTATMYRLINSTWTVVESKSSDITGRVQWTYTPGVKYRFSLSLTDYQSRVFDLDPILFSSYTVDMEKVVSLSNASEQIGVSIIFSPRSFSSDDTGNFTFLVSSPGGVLINYGANITFPLGTAEDTGTNAIGETFSLPFNLTGATASDTFILRYWYNTTIGGYREHTQTYRIRGLYGTTSMEALKNNHFGLGLLERIILGTVLTIIMAGVAMLVGGAMVAGVVTLLFLGLLLYVGLFPLWAVIVSMVIGFILLANKGD